MRKVLVSRVTGNLGTSRHFSDFAVNRALEKISGTTKAQMDVSSLAPAPQSRCAARKAVLLLGNLLVVTGQVR